MVDVPILPPDVNSIVHNEDLDTSGGAGALAASLQGGQLGVKVVSADNLQINREVQYLGFIYSDEASTLADADGLVQIGTKRAYEIPLELSDPWNHFSFIARSPLKLAPNENIAVTARSTGAAAEQHTCIHHVKDPGLGEAFKIGNVGGDDIEILVAQVTAALTAATISGFTDICGRSVAYVGGQNAIKSSKDIKVKLYGLTPFCSAGYSGVVIRSPKDTRQVAFMANGGKVTGGVTAMQAAKRYDMVEIFGGPLECQADQPLQLGAFGVGATAMWALLELGLQGVGIDG